MTIFNLNNSDTFHLTPLHKVLCPSHLSGNEAAPRVSLTLNGWGRPVVKIEKVTTMHRLWCTRFEADASSWTVPVVEEETIPLDTLIRKVKDYSEEAWKKGIGISDRHRGLDILAQLRLFSAQADQKINSNCFYRWLNKIWQYFTPSKRKDDLASIGGNFRRYTYDAFIEEFGKFEVSVQGSCVHPDSVLSYAPFEMNLFARLSRPVYAKGASIQARACVSKGDV